MKFNLWLEQSEKTRLEAERIANKIIDYISQENYKKTGFNYNQNKGFDLTPLFPEYPGLFLKFLNQIGFGNSALGHLSGSYWFGNVISISLPNRTKSSAVFPVYADNNQYRYDINTTVAKFLSKPQNYNTFIHEIIHYLDGRKTKDKIFKRYVSFEESPDDYFNHNSEYNANVQAFISQLNKFTKPENWQIVVDLLNKEDWYNSLSSYLKRKVLKRIWVALFGQSNEKNNNIAN